MFAAPALFWVVNILYWASYVALAAAHETHDSRGAGAAASSAVRAGPSARFAEILHAGSTLPLYAGAIIGRDHSTPARALSASAVIVASWIVVTRTLRSFPAWRFRADLAEGHELVTDGPFRFVRHPIYAGLALAEIGVVVFAPNALTIAGLITGGLGALLRANQEESLLRRAFPREYGAYARLVKRFVPGIY